MGRTMNVSAGDPNGLTRNRSLVAGICGEVRQPDDANLSRRLQSPVNANRFASRAGVVAICDRCAQRAAAA